MATQLSEHVKQLIAKARIVSFANWIDSYPSEVIQRFQKADDEGCYLTDSDLAQIQTQAPMAEPLLSTARLLRDNVAEIVTEAREKVLAQFPDITKPGGGLYPPARAEACWRDFWHFLRCITYGIAGGNTQFTSPEGLELMKLLYQELQVPLEAMVLGLEAIKAASLKRLALLMPEERSPQLKPETLNPYFDHLITQLKNFQSE